MAHFRGTVRGNRSEASRLGSKASGIHVEAQSWQGKVSVILFHDAESGLDMADVILAPHHSNGRLVTLYRGPVNGLVREGKGDFHPFHAKPEGMP